MCPLAWLPLFAKHRSHSIFFHDNYNSMLFIIADGKNQFLSDLPRFVPDDFDDDVSFYSPREENRLCRSTFSINNHDIPLRAKCKISAAFLMPLTVLKSFNIFAIFLICQIAEHIANRLSRYLHDSKMLCQSCREFGCTITLTILAMCRKI